MKDNSKVQPGVVIGGCIVYPVLFVLMCIYSNKNEVEMFISYPLCFIPYPVLGLTFGIFIGMDPQFGEFVKVLMVFFLKLLLAVLVFKVIRGISAFGTKFLPGISAIVAEDSDIDASLIGYSLINVFISAPIILIAMFLGRAIGKPFSKTKEAAE